MPSMYISVNPRKRRITVKPSFPITQRALGELDDIHTVYGFAGERSRGNRVTMGYTYGYELHETLAAVIFTLAEQTFVNIPIESIKITGNEHATAVLPQALEIAVLMSTWARFAAEVQANERLIAEINQRAEDYESAVRMANLSVKSERQRLAGNDPNLYLWLSKSLNEAIAKRRLIATNKRCDPGRKEKAQDRLNELEAEIRNLRPTWRKLVRSELQTIV